MLEHCDELRIFAAERLFLDRKGAFERSFGTRQVPETFQRDPKIVQVSGNIWVLRAKGVFVDTQGTLAGSFRVAKLANRNKVAPRQLRSLATFGCSGP